MVVLSADLLRAELGLLDVEGVVDDLHDDINHGLDFYDDARAHLFGCIRVPFVALPILDQSALSTVNNLSLIDRLLKHLVRVIFDLLRI